ncbi:hypothetical protein RCL1_003840 [Eukaryota sp. TZLM3-RCL]
MDEDNLSLEDIVVNPAPPPNGSYNLDNDRRWDADDAQTLDQSSSSIESSLFGLLYAMVKQNTVHKKASLVGLVVDFFLINSFGFGMSYDWGNYIVRPLRWLFDIFKILSWTWGKGLYIFSFILITLNILIILIDAVYVAAVFKRGKFTVIWPISLLRTLIALSVTILYIPFLTILTTMIDCRTISGVFGPDICFTYPHSIGAITAAIAIPLFFFIAMLMTLVYFDPDPNNKSPLGRPHSRIDAVYCLYRSILVFLNVLFHSQVLLRAIYLVFITVSMSFYVIWFQPFYKPKMNQIRAGMFGVCSCSAVVSLLTIQIKLGEFWPIIWMILVPVFYFIPYYLSAWKFKTMVFVDFSKPNSEVVRKVADSQSKKGSPLRPNLSTYSPPPLDSTEGQLVAKIKTDVKFRSVTDVEVATRFIKKHSNSTTILIANHIYQAALDKFPDSSYLHVAYGIFLMAYVNDSKKAAHHINMARKLGPFFDIRFTIFCQDKTQEQISKTANVAQGKSLTLMNFVEFQKNYTAARKYDQLTRVLMHRFWSNLLMSDVKLNLISNAIEEIDTASNKAQTAYEALVDKFSHSVDLLKSYASFLEDVIGDTERAMDYRKRALREMRKKKKKAKKRRKMLEDQGPSSLEQDAEQEDAIQIFEHDKAQQHSLESNAEGVGTIGGCDLKSSANNLRGKPLVKVLTSRLNFSFLVVILLCLFVSVSDVSILGNQSNILNHLRLLSDRTVATSVLVAHHNVTFIPSDLTQLNLETSAFSSLVYSQGSIFSNIGRYISTSLGFELTRNDLEYSSQSLISSSFSLVSPISPSLSPFISMSIFSAFSCLSHNSEYITIPSTASGIDASTNLAVMTFSQSISTSSINDLRLLISQISREIIYRLSFIGTIYLFCVLFFIYVLVGPLRFVLARVQFNRNVALNLLLRIPKSIIQHIISTRFLDEDVRGIPNEPVSSKSYQMKSQLSAPDLSLSLSGGESTVMTSSRDVTSSGTAHSSLNQSKMTSSKSKSASPNEIMISTQSNSDKSSSTEHSKSSDLSTSDVNFLKSKASIPSHHTPLHLNRSEIPVKKILKTNSSRVISPYSVPSMTSLNQSTPSLLVNRSSKQFKQIHWSFVSLLQSNSLSFLRILIVLVSITVLFSVFKSNVILSTYGNNQFSYRILSRELYNVSNHRINHESVVSKRFVVNGLSHNYREFLSSSLLFPSSFSLSTKLLHTLSHEISSINSLTQISRLIDLWTLSAIGKSSGYHVNDGQILSIFDLSMIDYDSTRDLIGLPDSEFFGSLTAYSHFLNISQDQSTGLQYHRHLSASSLVSSDFNNLKNSAKILSEKLDADLAKILNVHTDISFSLFSLRLVIIVLSVILIFLIGFTNYLGQILSKFKSNVKCEKFLFRAKILSFVAFLCLIVALLICLSSFSAQSTIIDSISTVDSAFSSRDLLMSSIYELHDLSLDYVISGDPTRAIKFQQSLLQSNQFVKSSKLSFLTPNDARLAKTFYYQLVKIFIFAMNQRSLTSSSLPLSLVLTSWDSNADTALFSYRIEDDVLASEFPWINVTLPEKSNGEHYHYSNYDADSAKSIVEITRIAQSTVADGRSLNLFNQLRFISDHRVSRLLADSQKNIVETNSSLSFRKTFTTALIIFFIVFYSISVQLILRGLKFSSNNPSQSSVSKVRMPLIAQLSQRTQLVLILLALMIFINIITVLMGNLSVSKLSASVGLSVQRESLIGQSLVLLNSLDSPTSEFDFSFYQLSKIIQDLAQTHQSLMIGSEFAGISSDSGRSIDPLQHLLYVEKCMYLDRFKCIASRQGVTGLESLFSSFLTRIQTFLSSSSRTFDAQTPRVIDVARELIDGFHRATVYYQEAAEYALARTRFLSTSLNVSCLFLVVLAWFFVFRPMSVTLLDEVRRTRSVLGLIPDEVMKNMQRLWQVLMSGGD